MKLTNNKKIAFFLQQNEIYNRDFSLKTNIDETTISRIINNKYMVSEKMIGKICEAYNMTRADFDEIGEGTTTFIVVRGNVRVMNIEAYMSSTWSAHQMIERVTAELLLPDLPSGHEYYALTVRGDSMQPTYNDRDMIVVQPIDGFNFLNDNVYLVLTAQGLVVKRLRLDRSTVAPDTVIFTSDNAQYAPERVHVSHILKLFKILKRICDV